MGVAPTGCTPPAKGSPLFELGPDEIEFGVGIHGQSGRERRGLGNADQLVAEMLEAVASDLRYRSGDQVALMVNGPGGTPISELCILFRRAHQQLEERGTTVGRSYVNGYCTSLDMAGASLTLVRLDDEIEQLLAAPAEAAVRVF
jgi:dihydroxyacetone kinase-like protein